MWLLWIAVVVLCGAVTFLFIGWSKLLQRVELLDFRLGLVENTECRISHRATITLIPKWGNLTKNLDEAEKRNLEQVASIPGFFIFHWQDAKSGIEFFWEKYSKEFLVNGNIVLIPFSLVISVDGIGTETSTDITYFPYRKIIDALKTVWNKTRDADFVLEGFPPSIESILIREGFVVSHEIAGAQHIYENLNEITHHYRDDEGKYREEKIKYRLTSNAVIWKFENEYASISIQPEFFFPGVELDNPGLPPFRDKIN